MNNLKHILIPVLVVVVIIGIYIGIPVLYDQYVVQTTTVQSGTLSFDLTNQHLMPTTKTSTPNTGEQIVQTGEVITGTFDASIALDAQKLTKPTRALLNQYQLEQDPNVLFELVSKLTDDGAYYTAVYLYQILLKQYPDKASYTTYLKLLLNRGNYSTGFLMTYQDTISTLLLNQKINDQDALFFNSFKTLIAGDVDTFYQQVNQLTGDYATIASDLKLNLKTFEQYKQAPRQYLRGLFASTLLRYGYYEPATQLAKQSLLYKPNYILGIQVSTYAQIMTHDRVDAYAGLQKLMKEDSAHLLTYQRLYGIVSYRRNEYKDAVWYLTQVNSVIPQAEMLRYIGLSYRELMDYLHVAKTYRELLTRYEPIGVDYFEFFDTYRRAFTYSSGAVLSGSNPIDHYDATLLSDYITRCESSMTGDQSYLCDIGNVLQLVRQDKSTDAIQVLTSIVRDHPYDYLYALIADLYQVNNQLPTAQLYYEKAVKATYDGGYKTYLQGKISTLVINEPQTN